jgi:hypothetical protein
MSPVIAPADPNVEGTNSGMGAGSCYPGIGIATAVTNPKESDWPRVDQLTVPGQPLGWGGDGTVTGQEDADIPLLKAVDYDNTDFNDTAIFDQCDLASVGAINIGDVYNATSGAALASTLDVALAENDWQWGVVLVA